VSVFDSDLLLEDLGDSEVVAPAGWHAVTQLGPVRHGRRALGVGSFLGDRGFGEGMLKFFANRTKALHQAVDLKVRDQYHYCGGDDR
jgi:hypothetical protein